MILFVTKYYAFDNNPFFKDSDTSKYINHETTIYECPMGYINNARRLKVIYYQSHPFYEMERIYGEDYESISGNYFNEKEMKTFYKISYTWIMEIEFITDIRSFTGVVLSSELILTLLDGVFSQSIQHIATHKFNIVILIILVISHTFYFFK